ncbi:MAG: hypothetical protein ABS63_01290 [Microbacterium sp. SCN 70-27]|uniref:hypothetical protein n=1 Tax=unclassified Microbacterium TaxID=2609290 RepID=UPI00086EA04B|nr:MULTISPECIES: hypothetical protein [unclassified Microbacterium]MBN9223164.1 hypothetical protein [Microbacterium sp.]ODT29146.1 MAG: hypothetical protein ABS63_01290 [Microbacterium sp. SCN 70-27]
MTLRALRMRTVLSALGVAFTGYLAAAALLWTTPPVLPIVQIASVALFLATTWLCIFWNARTEEAADPVRARLGERALLPGWAAVLAVTTAAIVPNASWLAAGPDARFAGYATWSLGAVGALMSIVMVRRRPWSAWTGVALAGVSSALWIGLPSAMAFGLVGAVLWVGVAQLLTRLLDGAARDTFELTRLQREASEWLASQEGMRRERRTQIQRALAVAGPVLAHTVAVGGHLDATARVLARNAEATLRDEIRGTALLDDGVRAALVAARAAGSSVSMQDEGGLDGIDAARREAVRDEVARVLWQTRSQHIIVRSSPHEDVAVTIVGRSADGDGEETVDLWHEVPRVGDES